MEYVFLKLFNMSISAGWVILAVLALRLLLQRAPKNCCLLLWGVVAFRLVCPFTFESVLSLIPSAETLAPEALYDRAPELTTGIPAVNEAVNPVFTGSFEVEGFNSVNPLQVAVILAANLWVLGMVVMGLYGVISYLRLRHKVAPALRLRENIWLCDHISTPFILGWIRPRVYLPSELSEEQYEAVIAHERAHIKHSDHWIKLIGFVLLSVYWFHPLIWVAYILLCRDIELACDEKVIREMDVSQKKAYSEALLACGMQKYRITACPVAFGESCVKQRIKAVLDYKKPTLWIILAAVVAVSVLAVCFLTDPLSQDSGNGGKIEDLSAPQSSQKNTKEFLVLLQQEIPQYFNLETGKGLDVYVWDEDGTLWCGLLPGTNDHKTQDQIDRLIGVSFASMDMILDTYENPKHVALYVLGASEYWGEQSRYVHNEPLELWLRDQLGLLEAGVLNNMHEGKKEMYLRYDSKALRYRATGQYAGSDQLGLCLTDKAENMIFTVTGGVSSGYQQFGYVRIYAIKGENTDRLVVKHTEDGYPLEIYELYRTE